MCRWLISCFLPVSLAFTCLGCTRFYHHWAKSAITADAVTSLRPAISTEWYRAGVDVSGRHLSGLMLIKKMTDSSTRVVMTNEPGLVMFDFSWSANGSFEAKQVMEQLNRKAVITTLRKDIELMLMCSLDQLNAFVRESGDEKIFIFHRGKDHFVYRTDEAVSTLMSLERWGNRKKVAVAATIPANGAVPDSMHLSHTGFSFTIALKKITRHAEE